MGSGDRHRLQRFIHNLRYTSASVIGQPAGRLALALLICLSESGATILGTLCTVQFAWMSHAVHPAVQKLVSSSERRRTLVEGSEYSMAYFKGF